MVQMCLPITTSKLQVEHCSKKSYDRGCCSHLQREYWKRGGSGTYQRGKVVDAIKSEDGLVRKALIEYIISGSKKTVCSDRSGKR